MGNSHGGKIEKMNPLFNCFSVKYDYQIKIYNLMIDDNDLLDFSQITGWRFQFFANYLIIYNCIASLYNDNPFNKLWVLDWSFENCSVLWLSITITESADIMETLINTIITKPNSQLMINGHYFSSWACLRDMPNNMALYLLKQKHKTLLVGNKSFCSVRARSPVSRLTKVKQEFQ